MIEKENIAGNIRETLLFCWAKINLQRNIYIKKNSKKSDGETSIGVTRKKFYKESLLELKKCEQKN